MKQTKSRNAYHLFEQLVNNKSLDIITKKSYQQRLSVSGQPIMGLAIIGKKQTSLPISLIEV